MQNSPENNQLLESLMNQLGQQDRERVKSLLSNKAACDKILNSPEAQDLIRKFKGGK
ncbi:MAG: hypothetical protein LKJ17_05450 [Oscillospiraceae bacterium]|jgi:hypothetical protein|nr:hypothetical protein [Oscillospiraceae bacterium]